MKKSAQGSLLHSKLRPTSACTSVAPESGLASFFTYAFHYFLASSRSRARGESWTSSWGVEGPLPAIFEMVRKRMHEHMELPEGFEVGCSPWDSSRSPLDVSPDFVLGLAIAYLNW